LQSRTSASPRGRWPCGMVRTGPRGQVPLVGVCSLGRCCRLSPSCHFGGGLEPPCRGSSWVVSLRGYGSAPRIHLLGVSIFLTGPCFGLGSRTRSTGSFLRGGRSGPGCRSKPCATGFRRGGGSISGNYVHPDQSQWLLSPQPVRWGRWVVGTGVWRIARWLVGQQLFVEVFV
jgi:hypothetical protein